MSAVIDNNATTTQSTKVKTPSLPEKYSKFIQFGYYMMTKMMDDNETSSFTRDEFLNKIQMFATVEEQQTFIQGFFDNQKDNKKRMRLSFFSKTSARHTALHLLHKEKEDP